LKLIENHDLITNSRDSYVKKLTRFDIIL